MDLFFTAMIFLCTVSPINEWVGDRDTGATCVLAAAPATFSTPTQCQFYINEALRELRTPEQQAIIEHRIPTHGDQRLKVRGRCIVEVVDEFLIQEAL